MSSHHIVREKQEPALLVLGLDDLQDEQLGQLLEWSPTVIATTDTAESLISRGIKVDWLIAGDFAEASQSDINLLPAGEDNLVGTALKFLVEQGYPSVNVVTDELNLGDYEPFLRGIDIVIFYHQHKIYPIASGFSKWKAKGEMITLYTSQLSLSVTGLKQINEGTWQTNTDGFFSLRFADEYLFIGEEI